MPFTRALKAAIIGLDTILSRIYGIYEYSQAPGCIARLAVGRASRAIILADGTEVAKGDPVGELHLWNKRMPPMPAGGPDLAWALGFQRSLRRSLEELAAYAAGNPAKLRGVRAFHGVGVFMADTSFRALATRLGFEVVEARSGKAARPGAGLASGPGGRPAGGVAERLWRRFAAFWENGFHLALMWAYNPPSVKAKAMSGLGRTEIWMSVDKLLTRYARPGAKAESAGFR